MPQPDFRTLEIAATAIEAGGMRIAAERLGLTQSAVSQAVKRAERQIGCPLLHRDRRPLAATAAGRALVEQVRSIALQTTIALDDIRAVGSQAAVRDVRLGIVDSVASTVGPSLIRALLDDSSPARVSAFSGLAPAQGEALLRDDVDIAITSNAMDGEDGLLRFPLYREPYVLACAPAVAGTLPGLELRDVLARRRLVCHSARSEMGAHVARHLRRLGIEQPMRLSFDTSDALLAMVAADVGVAIVTPLCLMRGGGMTAPVAVLPLPGPASSREITLIVRRGDQERLADRLAREARRILTDEIIPGIHATLPWLASRGGGGGTVLHGADTPR